MAYNRPSKRERDNRKGVPYKLPLPLKIKSDLDEGNGFFEFMEKPWKKSKYQF
jgi:hypothetical protein